MSTKVTIIVPIYNVEKYLRQCLDSIVDQTYHNLEILLIDDGSPDNCGAICDEYAAKDERIKVTHKKNAGLSAAWNDGLSMADGEWIAFIDSDDWLDRKYIETMVQAAQAGAVDIVQSAGYYWEESRGQFVRWAFLEPFWYGPEDKEGKERLKTLALLRPNDTKTKGTVGFTWGKLFRTAFLRKEGFKFDTQIRAGLMMDVLFDWDAFEKAAGIVGIVYCGYHYRVTQISGTYKYDANLPKAQEYIETLFFKRIERSDSSNLLRKAVESRCLRDIVHNLQRCYFHPENTASRAQIAAGIRQMKEMPYCKVAIDSKNNPYNNIKLKAFQLALKLPWVWPLRLMVNLWQVFDRKETELKTEQA